MYDRRVESFLAIVDTGGFTQAARRLFTTQPAITQQIRSLEADLGVELFTHERGRANLTEAGAIAAERLRPIVQLEEELLCDLAPYSGKLRDVSIGCVPDMMMFDTATLDDVMTQVRRVFGAGSRAVPMQGIESVGLLRKGALDIAFTTSTLVDHDGGEGIHYAAIFSQDFRIVCSPDHAIAALDAAPLETLAGTVVYLHHSVAVEMEPVVTALGLLEPPATIAFVDSLVPALPEIESGHAVGITSVIDKVLPESLARVPLDPSQGISIGIAWMAGKSDPAMLRLAERLRRVYGMSALFGSGKQ